jgi:oxalate---CoA ligase
VQTIDPPECSLEFSIADIWRHLLKRSDIGIDDDFFEAGGDSLLAEQMLLELEAAVGFPISPSVLTQAFTIRELAALMGQEASAQDIKVIKIKEGAGVPFFFCHGDYATGGLYALKLAASIDVPVYLIHPVFNVGQASQISMERMAQERVPILLKLQPSGSFRIGGYCNAGLLAWEIAHQLERHGREVESVTLIEVMSLNARSPFRMLHRIKPVLIGISPSKYLRGRIRDVMSVAWNTAQDSDEGLVRRPLAKETPFLQTFAFYSAFVILGLRKIFNLLRMTMLGEDHRKAIAQKMPALWLKFAPYLRAMANYRPPKLNCVANVIVCENNAGTMVWSPSPWRKFARKSFWTTVPGDHKTCVMEHVAALGHLVSAGLSSGRTEVSS